DRIPLNVPVPMRSRSVYLVRRHLEEEVELTFRVQLTGVIQDLCHQPDIVLDKRTRGIDRPVYVGLRSDVPDLGDISETPLGGVRQWLRQIAHHDLDPAVPLLIPFQRACDAVAVPLVSESDR